MRPWSEWQKILEPVQGPMLVEEAERLFDLAGRVAPDLWTVEIGCYRGYSGLSLAAGGLSRPLSRVVLVDAWGLAGIGEQENFGVMVRRAEETGLLDRIQPWRMPSAEAAALWPPGAKIGLLHIDGDHTLAGVGADVLLWQGHLAPGAAVAFHDYDPPYYPDVVRVVDALLAEREWTREGSVIGTQIVLRWQP